MSRQLLIVATFLSFSLLSLGATNGAPIKAEESEYQADMYKRLWETDLVTKLESLPKKGAVPEWRIPYSGHDYPDINGGTDIAVGSDGQSALAKYDRAFHGGRPLAQTYEKHDVGVQEGLGRPGGILWRMRTRSRGGWYGHCNGWTAASMRHPEPTKTVVVNGVRFTPADIKALLAEVYMYADTEFLGGVDSSINPGTFHITVANWVGRGDHPVGMESALGEQVYNYPIYSYESEVEKLSDNRYEVKMTVTYAYNAGYESDKSPRYNREKYFHYSLELNDKGEIVGGSYYGDSSQIDMLWAPLFPAQGGTEGNERGCSDISVKQVMALYRASVDDEMLVKWLNIDPDPEIVALAEKAEKNGSKKDKKEDKKDDVADADDEEATTEAVSSSGEERVVIEATDQPNREASEDEDGRVRRREEERPEPPVRRGIFGRRRGAE